MLVIAGQALLDMAFICSNTMAVVISTVFLGAAVPPKVFCSRRLSTASG